jgi:hypothetical protein
VKIKLEKYFDYQHRLPEKGQHIIGFQEDETIVVYQAYNSRIADFAVKNQFLGGSHFSYNRMSWIKPNFLWMMYRCGWAEKENQNRVIAIWINRGDFEEILKQAVFSSFNSNYYESQEKWKQELVLKDVRLQWDPDHDPNGNKLERRAIQLGVKNQALENFGKHQIKQIEDITDFVKEQKKLVDAKKLDELRVPFETIFQPANGELYSKVGINHKVK